MAFWRKNGVLICDPSGFLINCDTCPCDGISADIVFRGHFNPIICTEWGDIPPEERPDFDDEKNINSTLGVPTTWFLTGTILPEDLDPDGWGVFGLSGTVTTPSAVLDATLFIGFDRLSGFWHFDNLPLIIYSGEIGDYTGQNWSYIRGDYCAGSKWYGSDAWMACSTQSGILRNDHGIYSLDSYSCSATVPLEPGYIYTCEEPYGSYTFTMSENTEIPISYDLSGNLINYPFGTKKCSWSAAGDGWGACSEPPYPSGDPAPTPGIMYFPGFIYGGGDGSCELIIRRKELSGM